MKHVYTEFEQTIFDRALKNYKNKHGDHPTGMNFYYKSDIYRTEIWDEFWDKYLNSEEFLSITAPPRRPPLRKRTGVRNSNL